MTVRRLSVQIDHVRRFERMTEMLRKYENGVPVDEIAAQYDMHRSTVIRHARNAGLPKRPKQLISNEIRLLIVGKIREGLPQKDVCEEFNVSAGFVSNLGKANGLSRYETDKSGLERFLGVK